MENINELEQKVIAELEIDPSFLPSTYNDTERFNALRDLLIRRIEELAEKDMEKLLWILYRVDVSEKKLQQILGQTAPENFAATIADLIIERQMQKIETRKKYGSDNAEWDFDV